MAVAATTGVETHKEVFSEAKTLKATLADDGAGVFTLTTQGLRAIYCVADNITVVGAHALSARPKDLTWEIDLALMNTFAHAGAVITLPTIFRTGALHAWILRRDDEVRTANGSFIHLTIAVVVLSITELRLGIALGLAP